MTKVIIATTVLKTRRLHDYIVVDGLQESDLHSDVVPEFNDLALSEYSIAEFMAAHPNYAVIYAGEEASRLDKQRDRREKDIRKVFPHGLPSSFLKLDFNQKRCLVLHGASNVCTHIRIIEGTFSDNYNLMRDVVTDKKIETPVILNASTSEEYITSVAKRQQQRDYLALLNAERIAKRVDQPVFLISERLSFFPDVMNCMPSIEVHFHNEEKLLHSESMVSSSWRKAKVIKQRPTLDCDSLAQLKDFQSPAFKQLDFDPSSSSNLGDKGALPAVPYPLVGAALLITGLMGYGLHRFFSRKKPNTRSLATIKQKPEKKDNALFKQWSKTLREALNSDVDLRNKINMALGATIIIYNLCVTKEAGSIKSALMTYLIREILACVPVTADISKEDRDTFTTLLKAELEREFNKKNKKADQLIQDTLAFLLNELPQDALLPSLKNILEENTRQLSLPKFTLDKEKFSHHKQLAAQQKRHDNALMAVIENNYQNQKNASWNATKYKLLVLIMLFVIYQVTIKTYLNVTKIGMSLFDHVLKELEEMPAEDLVDVLFGQKKPDINFPGTVTSDFYDSVRYKTNLRKNLIYPSLAMGGLLMLSIFIDWYKNKWAFSPLDVVKKTPGLNTRFQSAAQRFNRHIVETVESNIFPIVNQAALGESKTGDIANGAQVLPFFAADQSSPPKSSTAEAHALARELLEKQQRKANSRAMRNASGD